MTASERMQGATTAVLLGWGVQLVLAAVPAWLAAGRLWRTVGAEPTGAAVLGTPGSGPALEAARRFAAAGSGHLGLSLGIAALGALSLGPWLTMMWLAALAKQQPVGRSASRGLQKYLPAVGTSLLVALASAVGVALLALLPFGAHLLLRHRPDARLHDLVVLAAALPMIVALAVAGTWHDQARAALLERSPLGAFVAGLRALRPGRVALFVWYWFVGVLLMLATVGVATASLTGPAGVAAVVILGQLTVLARLLVRARWLATCVQDLG